MGAPQKLNFRLRAFPFQKHSPYLEIFNFHLNLMHENGVLHKIKANYEPAPQKCSDNSGKPLTLNSCFSAFVVMIAGMVISIFLLISEHLSQKYDIQMFKPKIFGDETLMLKEELVKKDHELLILKKAIHDLNVENSSLRMTEVQT